MSITKTDYKNNNHNPETTFKQEISPTDKIKQHRKDLLIKQKETIDKKLEQLKTSISEKIRHFAYTIHYSQNPNDDPQGLFDQIGNTLSKMNLKNIADRNQTQLIIGRTNNKKENLYRIILRRQAEINSGIIERIKRESNNFELMKWSSKGIEVYVWGPYTPPAEEEIPETII